MPASILQRTEMLKGERTAWDALQTRDALEDVKSKADDAAKTKTSPEETRRPHIFTPNIPIQCKCRLEISRSLICLATYRRQPHTFSLDPLDSRRYTQFALLCIVEDLTDRIRQMEDRFESCLALHDNYASLCNTLWCIRSPTDFFRLVETFGKVLRTTDTGW